MSGEFAQGKAEGRSDALSFWNSLIRTQGGIAVKPSDPQPTLTLKREGTTLTVENGNLDLERTVKLLISEHKRDNAAKQLNNFTRVFNAPWTAGAVATMVTLNKLFPWVNLEDTQTLFGPQPPTLIEIDVEFGKKIRIPWGAFSVPNLNGQIRTLQRPNGAFQLVISAPACDENRANAIFEEVEKTLVTHNIYRGKAIRIGWAQAENQDGDEAELAMPSFMDLTAQATPLILDAATERQINIHLATPIAKWKACRENGIRMRRGVLLHGPPGVGKTLTMNNMARLAEESGVTFVYVDDARNLVKGMDMARMYAPSVLAAEDIDVFFRGPDRTTDIDTLLNRLDGVDTKDEEMLFILTTNHMEKLPKVMLRPGRLDAKIEFKATTPEQVDGLLRYFGRDVLPSGIQFPPVVTQGLVGRNPATVRELIERAKLAAMLEHDSAKELTPSSLIMAMEGF